MDRINYPMRKRLGSKYRLAYFAANLGSLVVELNGREIVSNPPIHHWAIFALRDATDARLAELIKWLFATIAT